MPLFKTMTKTRISKKSLAAFPSNIAKAIAYGDEYITEKPPKHATKATIQLSCTPQQRQTIKEYCSNQLPNFKRSRWIVGLLITKD